MREHQIVISLKSEHFQQVQRMARAAGSKSVGVFIRQRLLSALGLDGHDAIEPERGGPDWQRISGQLRRLHRELQVFIAESISTDVASPISSKDQPLIMPEENFLTEGAPVMPSYNYDYQARQAASTPPPAAPNKNVAAFDGQSDEMEKLAERAFAISPRLGALESIDTRAKNLQDPLNDLLGDSLLNASAAAGDDDEEYEEDEDDDDYATAEAQAAEETEESAQTADDQDDDDEDDQESSGSTAQQTAAPVYLGEVGETRQQSLALENDEADRLQRNSATNDEIDTQAQQESAAEDPKDIGNPPTPPPISGGPPPRKRGT